MRRKARLGDQPLAISPADADWPVQMSERLGEAAPATLEAIGPLTLLDARKTALLCSARTPGDAILRAHDAARRLRDGGTTVISGFHSPLERECLRILLRGRQPIIVCPARAIDRMRIAGELRSPFEAGRVLFLSPFTGSPRRVTRDSAVRRNEIVAALADEAFIAHISPDGETERLAEMMRGWGVPMISG